MNQRSGKRISKLYLYNPNRSELASDPEAFALFANLLRSFQANSLSSLDVGLISEALKAAYNIGYAMQNDSNHHPVCTLFMTFIELSSS